MAIDLLLTLIELYWKKLENDLNCNKRMIFRLTGAAKKNDRNALPQIFETNLFGKNNFSFLNRNYNANRFSAWVWRYENCMHYRDYSVNVYFEQKKL